MRVGIRESVRVGTRESVSAPPPAHMSHDYNAQLTKKNRGSAHPVRENSREREREREQEGLSSTERERLCQSCITAPNQKQEHYRRATKCDVTKCDEKRFTHLVSSN